MKFRLTQNLGSADAKACNERFGADLDTSAARLAEGSVINLPDSAAAYLGKKYPALMEPVSPIRAVAQSPRVKGDGETKANDKET